MTRSGWTSDSHDGRAGVPIGDAAKRLLRARGLDATVILADVMSAWEESVGPVVARHARPVALRSGRLVVEVDEPAWATEIQFQSETILASLRARLGDRAPGAVMARVGRPQARPPDIGGQTRPPA